ncbi:MAG: hypothetical protein WC828_03610 [Thermoleophilia bacterium]
MKRKPKILLTMWLALCLTVMMAAPALAVSKADPSGYGKAAVEVRFGDSLTGNRLPVTTTLTGDDIRVGGGISGPAEPGDLNCPGEESDYSGVSALFPPEDENNDPNNPGGSDGKEPPKITQNGNPGQPEITTTPQTPPPPATSTESGKLPNTGTQLILAGAAGLVIFLLAYGTRRAVARRVR